VGKKFIHPFQCVGFSLLRFLESLRARNVSVLLERKFFHVSMLGVNFVEVVHSPSLPLYLNRSSKSATLSKNASLIRALHSANRKFWIWGGKKTLQWPVLAL